MMSVEDELPKIFVIGFNKCGTRSLDMMFRASGIRTIHHGSKLLPERNAALRMNSNIMMGRPILHGMENFTAFSDLCFYSDSVIIESSRLFRAMHREYPDAYFILNVRPVENWLTSRFNNSSNNPRDLAQRACSALRCTKEELRGIWRQQHDRHVEDVESYFAANNTASFLKFDIESDDPIRIRDFLAPHFTIKTEAWGVVGRTADDMNKLKMRKSFYGRVMRIFHTRKRPRKDATVVRSGLMWIAVATLASDLN